MHLSRVEQGKSKTSDSHDLGVEKGKGWRDWDKALDEEDERAKNDGHMYEMLGGSFVMADRKFKVVARTCLD